VFVYDNSVESALSSERTLQHLLLIYSNLQPTVSNYEDEFVINPSPDGDQDFPRYISSRPTDIRASAGGWSL
jgi:hypothetical protein